MTSPFLLSNLFFAQCFSTSNAKSVLQTEVLSKAKSAVIRTAGKLGIYKTERTFVVFLGRILLGYNFYTC